jgi:integrase
MEAQALPSGPPPEKALELPASHAPGPLALLTGLPTADDVHRHLFGRLAELTRKAYEHDLRALAGYLGCTTSREAVGIFLALPAAQAHSVALGWLEAMRVPKEDYPEGLSAATQKRRISALSSVVTLARALGVVTWELKVQVRKGPKPNRIGYSPKVALALLKACGEDLEGARDGVVAHLVFGQAFRRVEVSRMRVRDYANGRIYVRGKGYERNEQKAEWVTATPETRKAIDRWLSLIGPLDPEGPLLFGWRNNGRATSAKSSASAGGLTSQGVYVILNNLCERAGIKGEVVEGMLIDRISPHRFRHTAANAVAKKRGVIGVQRLLRHSDIRTSMGYVDDLEDEGGEAAKLVEQTIAESEDTEPK